MINSYFLIFQIFFCKRFTEKTKRFDGANHKYIFTKIQKSIGIKEMLRIHQKIIGSKRKYNATEISSRKIKKNIYFYKNIVMNIPNKNYWGFKKSRFEWSCGNLWHIQIASYLFEIYPTIKYVDFLIFILCRPTKKWKLFVWHPSRNNFSCDRKNTKFLQPHFPNIFFVKDSKKKPRDSMMRIINNFLYFH